MFKMSSQATTDQEEHCKDNGFLLISHPYGLWFGWAPKVATGDLNQHPSSYLSVHHDWLRNGQ